MAHVPALPEVDAKVQQAFETLAGTSDRRIVYQVTGELSSGKSTFLRQLHRRLLDDGQTAILVQAPPRELDTGMLALVSLATGLSGPTMGDVLSALTDRGSWDAKLDLVRDALQACGDSLILLCDEPTAWLVSSLEAHHFRKRAHSVAHLALDESPGAKVVTGGLPGGRRPQGRLHLEATSQPEEWLRTGEYWGSLSDAAARLADRWGKVLSRYSPLEIRLLVSLEALGALPNASKPGLPGRHDLARRLKERISGDETLSALRESWARLALVRRTFPFELLSQLLPSRTVLDPVTSDILKHGLLYEQDGEFSLHEMLRRDVLGEEPWLTRQQVERAHASLAGYYASDFQASGGGLSGDVLALEMEAYHHAVQSNDGALLSRLRPYFSEQLDILGRTLSKDRREFAAAADVYRRALDWDPTDDYAHHYLAYNLDIQGLEPETVEQEYREALRLEPEHPWWWSRLVAFLVVRGRVAEAHEVWGKALDRLGLPDPFCSPQIYVDLHVAVARLLLHRGHLDFMAEVLRAIPEPVRDENPLVQALTRKMDSLRLAAEHRLPVPGPLLLQNWWQAPQYLLPRLETGPERVRWLLGRLEEIQEGDLHFRVTEVEGEEELPPSDARQLTVSCEVFDSWYPDLPSKELRVGDFVEIGVYRQRRNEQVRARVFPRRPWTDPGMPPLPMDPTRYLRTPRAS